MSSVRKSRVQRKQTESVTEQSDITLLSLEGSRNLLATNTGVRLACTMAAMLSPFAIFLCWAEKESRVIRIFAVQSVALLAVHLLSGAILAIVCLLVGSIPYLGFLLTLSGWLVYIAAALAVLFLRIKLMERAWYGRKFDIPLLERFIRRFY